MSYKSEEIQSTKDLRNIELCIKDLEDFSRKLFNNKKLKLGFRVYDGKQTIPFGDYLTNPGIKSDFKIYLVKDESFSSFDIVNHDIHKDKLFVGGFELAEMPGCCGIAVLYHVFICVDYRNKGFGQRLTRLQKLISSYKNYTVMVCTDKISNTPQRTVLKKFGFIPQFSFRNRRTNNLVEFRASNLDAIDDYDKLWKKRDSISLKLKNLKSFLKRIYTTTLTS